MGIVLIGIYWVYHKKTLKDTKTRSGTVLPGFSSKWLRRCRVAFGHAGGDRGPFDGEDQWLVKQE